MGAVFASIEEIKNVSSESKAKAAFPGHTGGERLQIAIMVASATASLAKSRATEMFATWKDMPLSATTLPSSLANLEPMLGLNPVHLTTRHYGCPE